MFLLYRVLFCNFENSSQFCKTFLGLISCKRCNIVFFFYLLYVVFIFPPCKCKKKKSTKMQNARAKLT